MNTRGKVQVLSGLILDYFTTNKAPAWSEISSDFIKYNVKQIIGMEKLSENFLMSVFKNSQDIQNKLEFFKDHHHYLTILLLKDEYCLESCTDCGILLRKIPIGMEENLVTSHSDWNLNY